MFGSRWLLLLIGDGQLSRYVTQLALMLDYRVIICDPRDVPLVDTVPDGVERVSMMPDEAVHSYVKQPRSVVVASRMIPNSTTWRCLSVQVPAFYVGAIGSHQLNSDGQCASCESTWASRPMQLQRLHAPVGLPIGSHRAPEIALSIMAEITALRNRAPQDTAADRTAST